MLPDTTTAVLAPVDRLGVAYFDHGDGVNTQLAFGGFDSTGPRDQLCKRPSNDQTPWDFLKPSNPAFTGRYGFGLTVDTCRNRVQIFAGVTQSGRVKELWEGAATAGTIDWQQRTMTVGNPPPPRDATSMVYDPERKVTVLHGGRDDGNNPLPDTWEYFPGVCP